MKKFSFLLLYCMALVCHSSVAFAGSSLEVRAAAFFPMASTFQNLYGHALPNFQIEASQTINQPFDIWANADFLHKHKTHSRDYKSSVDIMNGSAGIKFRLSFLNFYECYIGLGPIFGRVRVHNKSLCSSSSASKNAWGVVFKSGLNYAVMDNIYLDLFIDYLYQPVNFHRQVDVGGLKCGLGIGIRI